MSAMFRAKPSLRSRRVMKIECLDYPEFSLARNGESAFRGNGARYPYESWSKAHNDLVKLLCKHGQVDDTGHEGGDFYVLEDWFETGSLAIAILEWSALTVGFLEDCESFLKKRYHQFGISVVKGTPEIRDMFEIIITQSRSYLAFYERTSSQTRVILESNPNYQAVYTLLRD